MTKTINAAIVIYALLCIGLGVEAYVAKQSLPSLMGGGGIGVLELVSLFVWLGAVLLCIVRRGQFGQIRVLFACLVRNVADKASHVFVTFV